MKLNNWFIIRADVAEHIGIGHAMRCLAFAEWAVELSIKPILLCKQYNEFIDKKIKSLGGELIVLASDNIMSATAYAHSNWLKGSELDDAKACRLVISKLALQHNNAPLFIVVDHYALAAPWEKELEKIAPVLVIDDLSDRSHDCTWLVDQTFGKTRLNYENLIPPRTETFIGSEYALLRKEFSNLPYTKEKVAPHLTVKILITLGGVDKANDTQKIVEYLLINQELTLTVVTGSSNPHLAHLEELASRNLNIRIIVDSNNMAQLMSEHDLCIGAAGATSWERCAVGLPTITVVVADNQKEIAENLARNKAIINLGEVSHLTKRTLIEAVEKLVHSKKMFKTLVSNSRKVCDGRGAARILASVSRFSEKNNHTSTHCRLATNNDITLVFDWQKTPETRRFSLNKNIPTFKEHQQWMLKKLESINDYFYIIETRNQVNHKALSAGVVRLDKSADDIYTISIFIEPKYFGQGIAQQALNFINVVHPDITINATVLKENIASQKLFSRLNYQKLDSETYQRSPIKQ